MRYEVTKDDVFEYDDNGQQLRQSTTDHVFGEIQTENQKLRTGLLEPAVRWISSTGNALLLERPPFYLQMEFQTLSARSRDRDAKTRTYSIPVPWTETFVVWASGHNQPPRAIVFARADALSTLDDPLFVLPFPNQYADAGVCFGNEFAKEYQHKFGASSEHTIADELHLVNAHQWGGRYNMDLWNWIENWRLPANWPPQLLVIDDQLVPPNTRIAIATSILAFMEKHQLHDILSWDFRPSHEYRWDGDRVRDVIAALDLDENASQTGWERLLQTFNRGRVKDLQQAKKKDAKKFFKVV